ncbi:MAG: PUA domain-containing protein [Haloarculaceae archaeon]
MDEEDRSLLTRVADYQFGRGAGTTLFPPGEVLEVTHASSGRPRQIRGPDGRLATYGTAGRLTLGVTGGAWLHAGLPDGDYRVVVGQKSEPFVRDGGNVFAKFVREADRGIRPRDEVLVVHEEGRLLGVGRAVLSGAGMLDFETGMAVRIREGVGD